MFRKVDVKVNKVTRSVLDLGSIYPGRTLRRIRQIIVVLLLRSVYVSCERQDFKENKVTCCDRGRTIIDKTLRRVRIGVELVSM